MHVLLDENLDWRLVKYFDSDFQVTNVNQQGWTGKRDSELLRQAAATFDVLVTMDKGSVNMLSVSLSSLPEAVDYRTFNLLCWK